MSGKDLALCKWQSGRSHLWLQIVAILVVGVVILIWLVSAKKSPVEDLETTADAATASSTGTSSPSPSVVSIPKQTQLCNPDDPQLIATYSALMQSAKYWDAANHVRRCATESNSQSLATLLKDAEVKSLLTDIGNQKLSLIERARYMEMLIREYPDVAVSHKISDQLQRAEKQLAAERKKWKPTNGRVWIGMTDQQVIDIGWGKPQDINRTTTASGTREQWVYGSGNYLYFDDGVLTAIQN